MGASMVTADAPTGSAIETVAAGATGGAAACATTAVGADRCTRTVVPDHVTSTSVSPSSARTEPRSRTIPTIAVDISVPRPARRARLGTLRAGRGTLRAGRGTLP